MAKSDHLLAVHARMGRCYLQARAPRSSTSNACSRAPLVSGAMHGAWGAWAGARSYACKAAACRAPATCAPLPRRRHFLCCPSRDCAIFPRSAAALPPKDPLIMSNGMDMLEMVCNAYESPEGGEDGGGSEDEVEQYDLSERAPGAWGLNTREAAWLGLGDDAAVAGHSHPMLQVACKLATALL